MVFIQYPQGEASVEAPNSFPLLKNADGTYDLGLFTSLPTDQLKVKLHYVIEN